MDFIVSEFINLIKRCSNGLALEKEIWRRGIELQCRDFAQALETYDAEMARQYAGKQEVLRIDWRTVLCMFGTVTFARRLVRRWSKDGGLAMVKVISGLKNGDLEQALAGELCRISMKTRKEYRNAVREALKKPLFIPHVGVHQCCIANYGPSSSPMGHLAAVLNW